MKKIPLTILTFTSLGVLTLGALVGCNSSSSSAIETDENKTFAAEVVTAFNIRPQMTDRSILYAEGADISFDIDGLISKTDGLLSQSIDVRDEEVDKEGYLAKKILTLNDDPYTLYFDTIDEFGNGQGNQNGQCGQNNQNSGGCQNGQNNKNCQKTTKKKGLFQNKKKDQTKTKFSGIVLHEDDTYTFDAKEMIETRNNVEKRKMHFTMYIDETTSVMVKQDYVLEGEKYFESFTYHYVTGNVDEECYKVMRALDGDSTSIKIIENGNAYQLNFYTKNELNYVEVKKDDEKHVYQIVVETLEDGSMIKTYQAVEEKTEDTTTDDESEDVTSVEESSEVK